MSFVAATISSSNSLLSLLSTVISADAVVVPAAPAPSSFAVRLSRVRAVLAGAGGKGGDCEGWAAARCEGATVARGEKGVRLGGGWSEVEDTLTGCGTGEEGCASSPPGSLKPECLTLSWSVSSPFSPRLRLCPGACAVMRCDRCSSKSCRILRSYSWSLDAIPPSSEQRGAAGPGPAQPRSSVRTGFDGCGVNRVKSKLLEKSYMAAEVHT